MSPAQELGRKWADSQWGRADARRRGLPLTLSAEAWLEVVMWAAEANLLASDIFELTKAAKVRWRELQAGGRGSSSGSDSTGRVHRYLGTVSE